jgi:hypothetical protein
LENYIIKELNFDKNDIDKLKKQYSNWEIKNVFTKCNFKKN